MFVLNELLSHTILRDGKTGANVTPGAICEPPWPEVSFVPVTETLENIIKGVTATAGRAALSLI